MIRRLALAASDPELLADAVAACDADTLVAPPGCHRDLAGVTGAALADALTSVPPEHRATVPIVLAVSGPAVAAASRFAARCLETARRLRPSDSVRMEIAELVRAFGVTAGWHGLCYLVATVDADGRQAVLTAAALRRRHPAVLVGELLAEPDPTGGVAGRDGTMPGVLAVVARWDEPLTTNLLNPGPAATGPGGSLLLTLAGRVPVGQR